MKLVTLSNGTHDGMLAVASRDGMRVAPATGIAATMQEAIERWSEVEPRLRALAGQVEEGDAAGLILFDPAQARAPLPRAWQWLDGSAYASHGALMDQVFGMPPKMITMPLMYQGMSHCFLGPQEDVPFITEEDGIDFEGEFGVIVDDVPMGIGAAEALDHIRLVVQINDWSLRTIAPIEMKTGFGWVGAKPACSMAPFALTPDALGALWQDGRVRADLHVDWNGERFGAANGAAMDPGFGGLIAHAARTRALCAGTIIGSGTVSNANFRDIGSSCIAERRGIEVVDEGQPRTGFMRFGDRVRMTVPAGDGTCLFGAIDQRVVRVLT